MLTIITNSTEVSWSPDPQLKAWQIRQYFFAHFSHGVLQKVIFKKITPQTYEILLGLHLANFSKVELVFHVGQIQDLIKLCLAKDLLIERKILLLAADREIFEVASRFVDEKYNDLNLTIKTNEQFCAQTRNMLREKHGLGPAARAFFLAHPNLHLVQAQKVAELFVDVLMKTHFNSFLFIMGSTQDLNTEYSNYESIPNKFFTELDREIRRSYVERLGPAERIIILPQFNSINFSEYLNLADVFISCTLPPYSPTEQLLQSLHVPTLLLGPRERKILEGLNCKNKVIPVDWDFQNLSSPTLCTKSNYVNLASASLEYTSHEEGFHLDFQFPRKAAQEFKGFKLISTIFSNNFNEFPHYMYQEKKIIMRPSRIYNEIFGLNGL